MSYPDDRAGGGLFSQITLPAVPVLAYLMLGGIAAGDLFLPVLPTGATMITAGVLAADGDLSPIWVFVAGLLGAWAGDLAGYRIGYRLRRLRGRARRPGWLPKHDRRLGGRWERRLGRHGVPVLVLARYVPAGRTAAALGAGRVGAGGRRFVLSALVAEALWAGPATLIGYTGGNLLPYWMLPAAIGVMLALTLVTLVVMVVRRRKRRPGGAAPADSADTSTTTG